MNVFGDAEDCCALGSISVRQKVMKKKTLPNFEKIFLLLIKLVCFGGFFFLFCGKIRLPVETSDANLSNWNVIVQAQLIMEMILPLRMGNQIDANQRSPSISNMTKYRKNLENLRHPFKLWTLTEFQNVWGHLIIA